MASPVFLLSDLLVEDVLKGTIPASVLHMILESAAEDLRCWCRHRAVVGQDRLSIREIDHDHQMEVRMAYDLLQRKGWIQHHSPDTFSVVSQHS